MSTALLHRRLTAAMALSALMALMAGAGASPALLLTAAALGVATFRLPPPEWSVWIERASRFVILGLCAWMLYVAFALGQDFMPAVMAMLLFLLAAESLRAVDAKNDARLYLLSFALLLAATAYYPGLGFALSFIAFIVLSTLALMVGYLRRQSERFGMPGVRLGRRMMITIAAFSGVILLISASLFVLFPRLPRQWNVQGRRGGGETMAGFSDQVRLGQHGGRIVPNPEVAFRVEFTDGVPPQTENLYWRGRSFDRFDGEQWTRSRGVVAPLLPPSVYGRRWGGPIRRMRIFGGPPEADVLFGNHPLMYVQPRSAIRVFQDYTGDVRYSGTDAPVYTTTSAGPRPTERALRTSDVPDGPLTRPYLQLPDRLDPRIQRLADSLTAGQTTRIERVRAIERHFASGFAYTLELPRTARDATLEGFLFRRRAGHCEYYSTAMAVLLRAAGIPARNVTGFLGGEWNGFGDYLAVTGNDAHSWVEVWMGQMGWVPFDPTPPGRADLVAAETEDGWLWPAALWFDGLEYHWFKWVLDYNLEKQLGLFSRVGDLFSRDDRRGSDAGGAGGAGRGVAVVIALGVLGALLWNARRWRHVRLTEETRTYLALRRAYVRAGLDGGGGPLDFAERLASGRAPGAGPAAELVRLYLRARFGREDIGDVGRARMRRLLDDARAELRAAKRKPARLA
ncbi:MAG TPA: transglutaminaseTgpA domain-containing protein [Longimicrobium sp.]|nr:transglutaminaseTgpA domain-containing protein [Longimicrobium sp.]